MPMSYWPTSTGAAAAAERRTEIAPGAGERLAPGLTRQALLVPDRRALNGAPPGLNLSQGQPPRGDMGVPQAPRPPAAGAALLHASGRCSAGNMGRTPADGTVPRCNLSGEGRQRAAMRRPQESRPADTKAPPSSVRHAAVRCKLVALQHCMCNGACWA